MDNTLFKSEGVSIALDMFLAILFSDVGVFSLSDKLLSFVSFSVSTLELRISGLEPSLSHSLDARFSFPFSDCVSFCWTFLMLPFHFLRMWY